MNTPSLATLGHLVERSQKGFRRRKCVQAGRRGGLPAVLERQLSAYSPDELGLMANDRQHPAQEDQVTAPYRFDVSARRVSAAEEA